MQGGSWVPISVRTWIFACMTKFLW